MTVLADERRQPWITLRCDVCGGRFDISLRNAQRYRANGREPRCTTCRRPRKPLSDDERTRYERYWLDRFSLEELVELAEAIWR